MVIVTGAFGYVMTGCRPVSSAEIDHLICLYGDGLSHNYLCGDVSGIRQMILNDRCSHRSDVCASSIACPSSRPQSNDTHNRSDYWCPDDVESSWSVSCPDFESVSVSESRSSACGTGLVCHRALSGLSDRCHSGTCTGAVVRYTQFMYMYSRRH